MATISALGFIAVWQQTTGLFQHCPLSGDQAKRRADPVGGEHYHHGGHHRDDGGADVRRDRS